MLEFFGFSFSELYSFILALVGMILTYLAKRKKRKTKHNQQSESK